MVDQHREPSVEQLPTLWGLHLVVGVLAAGIGTAILLWPDATRTVVKVFFGWSFIVSGVVWVVQGFRSSLMKSGAYILLGLLAIGVGVFVLAYGRATVVLLTFLLGFALLFRGTLLIARRMLQPRPPGSGPPVVEIVRARYQMSKTELFQQP